MAGPPLLAHGEEAMDSSPRWCKEEPCRRRPFFGPPGGKPLYCAQHSKKSEGMVDVSSRRCEAVGCAKWPLYGNEGQKAKFCSLHKRSSMIDVRSRRCAAKECKRQPSYGFEGKRACFCAAHKAQGMVDVVSRRCEEPDCRRRPLYGYEGQKSQFCSAHKQAGQVDVCNRRCQQAGCSKRPCFGLPGRRPCFCGSHRTPEMVDVISHKCGYPGCSHPTGYEANRVRSKFCDKHKSVGLAGASLLQLAGATTGDSAVPRASPVEPVGQLTEGALPKSDRPREDPWGGDLGPGAPLEGWCGELSSEQAPAAGTVKPPQRRASYTVTAPPGPECSLSFEAPGGSPKRRSTMPVRALPSVQSLLDDSPRGCLKRQRDRRGGGGGGGLYNMEVDAPPLPAASSPSSSSSSVPPPQAPQGAPGLARLVFGARGGGGGKGVGNGGGGGDKNSCDKNVPGNGVIDDEKSRATSSCAAGAATATATADEGAAASSQSRPPARAKRLFCGPEKEGQGGWESKVPVWSSTPNADNVGYLTTSPAPDWRQIGLASIGRAASFDEAREAADRKGFGMAAEDSSKPRRASAFVNNGSALTPIVTELGRRGSAFEQRAISNVRHVPRFSDLLSATKASRSVTVFGRGSNPRLLGNPDARIEEERGGSGAGGGISSGAAASSGIPRWKSSSPTDWPSPDAAAAGTAAAGRAPDSRPPAQAPTPSRAAKMFHVMPATAVYTAGMVSHPRDEVPAAAASSPAGFDWRRRPPANSQGGGEWECQRVGEGEGTSRMEESPRSPSRSTAGRGSGAESDAAAAAAATGRGGAEPQPEARQAGAGRRWSVLDQAQSLPTDQDGAASMFVPAWGAAIEEEENGDEGRGGDAAGALDDAGTGNRRRSMATVGVRSVGGTAEEHMGTLGGRPPRRGSMVGQVLSGAADGSGTQVAPQRGRWSPADQSSAPSDHQRGGAVTSFLPAWGSTPEEGSGEEPTTAPYKGASAAGIFSARGGGNGRRTGVLFNGGGGIGQGDNLPLTRQPPSVRSMESQGVLTGSGGSVHQRRRGSVMERSPSPVSDQRGRTPSSSSSPSGNAFARSWGAPVEDGLAPAGPSCVEDMGGTFFYAATSAGSSPGSGSARRGSLVVPAAGRHGAPPPDQNSAGTMGPPVPRRGSMVVTGLAAGEREEVAAVAQAGQRRRGSVACAVSSPPKAQQQRRGSVIGMEAMATQDEPYSAVAMAQADGRPWRRDDSMAAAGQRSTAEPAGGKALS